MKLEIEVKEFNTNPNYMGMANSYPDGGFYFNRGSVFFVSGNFIQLITSIKNKATCKYCTLPIFSLIYTGGSYSRKNYIEKDFSNEKIKKEVINGEHEPCYISWINSSKDQSTVKWSFEKRLKKIKECQR